MYAILLPALIIGGIGAVCGIVLAVASVVMAVPVDKKVEQIKDILPGANCGACGLPGCDAFAEAVAQKEAAITACPPGGQQVVDALSEILGVATEEAVRLTAVVRCGCCDVKRTEKMEYVGALTCTYASQMYGGPTACFYACQGFGDCVPACKYDAIRLINGIAAVDPARCIACTLCLESCPKGLIQMAPAANAAIITCISPARGAEVRKVCPVGCIGCSLCVKACPNGAMSVENYLAQVDYDTCTGCKACVTACPQGTIYIGGS